MPEYPGNPAQAALTVLTLPSIDSIQMQQAQGFAMLAIAEGLQAVAEALIEIKRDFISVELLNR